MPLSCHPLRDVAPINDRLDAVEDLMKDQTTTEAFSKACASLLDLERTLSRVHAGKCKASVFMKLLANLKTVSDFFSRLEISDLGYKSKSLATLLERAPDVGKKVEAIRATFTEEECKHFTFAFRPS